MAGENRKIDSSYLVATSKFFQLMLISLKYMKDKGGMSLCLFDIKPFINYYS